jgi:hypothetical protein
MSVVRYIVDGSNQKLQPILKPDPRDRAAWVYPECDLCFRRVCDKHSVEIAGQIVCDRCRQERVSRRQPQLIDLSIKTA